MKRALPAIGAACLALALAAPAHADRDTDFANTLHTYGIYGQRDYNAWIAKITCHRLTQGIDHNADDSSRFVAKQLDRKGTTQQAWQFLGLTIETYCPEHSHVMQQAAEKYS